MTENINQYQSLIHQQAREIERLNKELANLQHEHSCTGGPLGKRKISYARPVS